MITVLFFLSSGLFLGWSLGANDAANVFGTAVGTKMIRFRTAALICSIFVILGAVISGAGASHTLGKLGAVNALGGSFTVALAAAITVLWMTKLSLPVSTSQAVVGAIIGWNVYSNSITDPAALTKIMATWFICPVLACGFSAILYLGFKRFYENTKIHLLDLDNYTRIGLVIVGAFGSYSLGANNIANVMGVFVPVSPFHEFTILNLFEISSAQQLFLIGGVAISVGVYTYSRRVMETVGGSIFKLSPVGAFVVVAASSIVLFLFASQDLKTWLILHHLPSLPLVPVSSSQAVVGAVLGIGLIKCPKNINYWVLGRISFGWISTPIIAGLISFFFLSFVQNVFRQEVYKEKVFALNPDGLTRSEADGQQTQKLRTLINKKYRSAIAFREALQKAGILQPNLLTKLISLGEKRPLFVDGATVRRPNFGKGLLSEIQKKSLFNLIGFHFEYPWQLLDKLGNQTAEWKELPNTEENKPFNKALHTKIDYLIRKLELATTHAL